MNNIEQKAVDFSQWLMDKKGDNPVFEIDDCKKSFITGAEWILDIVSKWLVDNYPISASNIKDEKCKVKYLKACQNLISNFVNEIKGTDVITVENLEERGWKRILDFLPFPDENCFWTKNIDKYKLELCNFSNTPGKLWNIHIDNDRCESIASMDVQTFSDINKLISLIED